MAVINTGPLPIQSINQQILDALKDPASSQIVSAQLNSVLQTALIASANSHGAPPALVSLLGTLRPADFAADQNLSLRDFVAKYATLPTDPTANKAAQQAIATLSTSTTVGQFLGLNQTVAANPIFSGFVAQTNLVSLMATSPTLASAPLQTDFIQKYSSFQGSIQDFWNQISKDATLKAAIPELQFTMQLGVLTLNNPALVSALRASYKPTSIRDLTKVNVSTLTQFITTQKISVPAAISGSTPAEQIANYASGIVALLQLAFPTDYVAQALSSSKDTTLQSVAKVLGNAPDIDLQLTNLGTYLTQNSAKAFQGIPTAQISAVTARLEGTQRVFRINSQPNVVTALLGAGMDSAAKITAMASSNFVGQFSAALGGDSVGQSVYAAASHINAQTLNLYTTIQSGLRDVSPRVIADPNLTAAQAIQQQIPNWQTLFGYTSYCTCGECNSVYGPAAYFVDLLQFLRHSGKNGANNTPLDILIGNPGATPPIQGRRPDLQYIKLDCQNANTPLPYADLVNEILESYVAPPGGQLGQSTAHNTQSDATAAELRVNPENVLQKAYDQLGAATYPPSLPYNRFLDIARTYLTFLGGDRRQVIQRFGTEVAPFDTVGTLAAETLGLSPFEFTIIANWDLSSSAATTPIPLNSVYVGNTPATSPWETWIATASIFLQQTGLTFDDLVNLLEAEFTNPGQTITLTGASACDIENTVISPLDDAALTRIYPFLRLWKKLGWSMSDLDKFLRVFGTNGINRGCLLALADFVWLMGQLNLTVAQLLALWSPIDTDGRNSLYLTLFQNKTVLNPVDTALQLSYRAPLAAEPASPPASVALQMSYDQPHQELVFAGKMTDEQRDDLLGWASGNPAAILAVENLYEMRWFNGTDIAQPAGTITGETPAILAALRISADDLNAIRTTTPGLADSTTQTPLALNNLSQLYRYTLLSQAIGLSVTDLIALISLTGTGINPFQLATTDPVTTPAVQFVRAAQAVQASPFAVSDLNYIYRAVANPAAGVGPLEATVDLLAITLQTGQGKIAAANFYTPDPTGKVLRQKLGTIVAGPALDAAMGLISGTGVYKAALSLLPVTLPTTMPQISYDAMAGVLEFSGAMLDSQQSALVLLSSNSDYLKAVSSLYQQPRAIISNSLSFLDPSDALSRFITSPVGTAADRYAYVLQALLTYLTATQSRTFLQQTLGQTFGLSSEMVALLLIGDPSLSSSALLHSQRDSTQPAIVDLLDLQPGGLLETVYSDTALINSVSTQVATSVTLGKISNPGGATWQGKIQPEFSEPYRFYVTANDGVRLSVDGQILIEHWPSPPIPQPSTQYPSALINLNAGQLYDIRLDYFNMSANAAISLGWSSQSTSNNVNTPIPVTAVFPKNAFLTLDRLYPVALLLSKFAVKPDELAYLSSHGGNFQGVDPGNAANKVSFDLTALPLDRSNPSTADQLAPAFFNQWLRLNDLFQLRNSLPAGNTTLFDIFRTASGSTNPPVSPATISAVLAATGWDPLQFSTLAGKTTNGTATVGFGLSDADFVNENGTQGRGLVWLQKCLALSQRLGIPVLQLFLWANQPPDAPQSDDIKNTVKAKYDDTTWTTVGQPLNDKIRDHSKSALIAYVLDMTSIIQLGFRTSDDLYTYFLIDVQMSPCMLTSRLVQATAAVQLFVQRCLLNLERNTNKPELDISPAAICAKQWDEWRKNYRIWEANREVFLYPENWIDPTLRDNRTPFFEDLQADLQKGPVTADTAEAAFQTYLTKLLEVSRLEICGFFYQDDSDSTVTRNVFHVFGRTYATPHNYYYRTFDLTTSVWSTWESVDVDIQGDHLIPVVWNRRLYIFWPLFQEQNNPPNATVPVPAAGPSASVQTPLKSLQVSLAWSEYRDGAWTKKQVTADSLVPNGFGSYTGDLDLGQFSFNAQPSDPSLTINMFSWESLLVKEALRLLPPPGLFHLPYGLFNCGSFFFDGCSSVPVISPVGGQATAYTPYNTYFDYMSLNEYGGGANLELINLTDPYTETLSNGEVIIKWGASTPVTVLGATPTAFSLAYPSEYLPTVQISLAPPFFYADNVRTYLVTQQSGGIWTTFGNPLAAVIPYSPEELSPAVSSAMVAPLPVFADEVPVVNVGGTLANVQIKKASPLRAAPMNAVPINTTPWENLFPRPIVEFTFTTHRHAHVCDFLKALNWQGVPGLMTLANQELDDQDVGTASMFYQLYQPTNLVNTDYPSEQVDFSYDGPYSIYNWEVFFHIPLLIATQLSQNQQFEDAETWFRYIFNPTSSATEPAVGPGRYWNFLPFNQDTDPEKIEDLVNVLAYTGTDPTILAEKASYENQITAWQNTPFDPDLIARMRIVAYQKATVMKYINHQLAWGDSLYQQFTRESVNEATLHYVLCQDILGDKPVAFPPQGYIAGQTYAQLVADGVDAFSDALVTLENLFPFSSSSTSDSGSSGAATGIAALYFCVPPNDMLLGYWDTVAQRLYQIRHCMNIAGQIETLPLFAPPINPGALIQALEMGMDLTSALGDISAATPFYRFSYLLPKALELCAEVRSLGSSLLSALEKSDAEALSMLRATQETALMKAIRNVKQQQLNEANSNLDALNDTLAVTQTRQQYYQSLVSAGLSAYETTQISLLTQARTFQGLSQQALTFGSSVAAIPDETVGTVAPLPLAGAQFGGRQLAAIADFVGGGFGMLAAMSSSSANISGIQGGFARRNQEWQFQLQTATLEIQQINDQIKAAQARVDAAQADLDNQDLQISNASDVEDFLRTKYTNQDLYDWMVGQVSSVYFQCYQMAYYLAKSAEACYIFERMPNLTNYTSFIQFGYWDSLKKGLLSGERMYQDLKHLEIAYMDQNQRDFEITKSISLLLLDPMALINLKETGYCTVQFPEPLFDMDYPGHYLRRIKSLSMTVPCVVGPYTSLNCTLTLATNKIRIDTNASNYGNDSHFVTNFAASESIATSSGQNDSGLFVVNFNDERYLPFEGAGVISTWQLSMPLDTNAFDFDTITDVIFNLKYTARDGGDTLRSAARATALMPPGSTTGASPGGQTAIPAQQTLSRMFSLRHEFPSAWNAFLHPPDAVPDQTMTINLTQERFPFQYRGKKIQIYEVDVFLKFRDIYDPTKYTTNGTPLGDYAAGTPLTLNLTPPGGIASALHLASNAALLFGVPAGSVPQPPPVVPPAPPVLGALGSWTLVAKGTDIANIAASLRTQVAGGATTNNRIAIAAIEDVFLVTRYFTS